MLPVTFDALCEELEKIAGVNLLGLKPETVMAHEPPPPLETPGVQKAMAVLDRLEMSKAASAPRKKRKDKDRAGGVMPHQLPMMHHLTDKPGDLKPNAWDEVKSTGGHALAGAGVGRFIAEFTPKGADPVKKYKYTRNGLVVGLADNAYKRYRKHHAKKHSAEQVKTAAEKDEKPKSRAVRNGALAGGVAGVVGGVARSALEARRFGSKPYLSDLAVSGGVHGVLGAAVGTLGAGAYELGRKALSKKQLEKRAMGFSPAKALQAGQETAKRDARVVSGPALKTQIRGALIGRKGVPT